MTNEVSLENHIERIITNFSKRKKLLITLHEVIKESEESTYSSLDMCNLLAIAKDSSVLYTKNRIEHRKLYDLSSRKYARESHKYSEPYKTPEFALAVAATIDYLRRYGETLSCNKYQTIINDAKEFIRIADIHLD